MKKMHESLVALESYISKRLNTSFASVINIVKFYYELYKEKICV
jgi:hypothetical protein